MDVLLTGNAFAVHNIEKSLFGTSLGVCQKKGDSVKGGHRNHLRAINAINKQGSIKKAVETGVLISGGAESIMRALEGVELVIMAASTLHSIAAGNLLKANVKTVCVDINESVPVKLSNRGSKQAVGIVTDVAFFFRALAGKLG